MFAIGLRMPGLLLPQASGETAAGLEVLAGSDPVAIRLREGLGPSSHGAAQRTSERNESWPVWAGPF